NDVYHDVFSYVVNLDFDVQRFTKIWEKLILEHPLLRVALTKTLHGFYNIVYRNISLDSKLEIKESNETVDMLIGKEKNVDFDLESPGLFRILIVPYHTNN